MCLTELLNRNRIPAPKTLIISTDKKDTVGKALRFPCILKQPVSSFSVGVVKVDNAEGFEAQTEELFEKIGPVDRSVQKTDETRCARI